MKTSSYIATILAVTTACHDIEEFDFGKQDTSQSIDILNGSAILLLADNQSSSIVEVKIPSESADGKREITFSTNLGRFKESDSSVYKTSESNRDENGNRILKATLLAGIKPGSGKIRASINSELFDEVDFLFDTAYAESLRINPSAFIVKSGPKNEIQITVELMRKVGKPSIGNSVQFEVRDEADARDLGLLRNLKNRSDENGLASATIAVSDSTYTGNVLIRGKVLDSTRNETAKQTITIIATN